MLCASLRVVLFLMLKFAGSSSGVPMPCLASTCKNGRSLLQSKHHVEIATSHDQVYFEQHAWRKKRESEPKEAVRGPTAMLQVGHTGSSDMNGVNIWPYPKSLGISGPPMRVAEQLIVNTTSQSTIMSAGIDRFQKNLHLVANVSSSADVEDAHTLNSLTVFVAHPDERLSSQTDYSYEVAISPSGAEIQANSVYGALYAFETVLQLAVGGSFPGSHIAISDAPDYAWRGVLVDAGRRFVPISLLENTIDVMSAVKLNVLHLHLSDYGRFAVQSGEVPELDLSLHGDASGAYTQEEIKALVAYAKMRGVRVMPEIDLPGHARPWRAVGSKVAFCGDTREMDTQLFGSNATLRTTAAVLQEIVSLFEDDAAHVGGDETEVFGRCKRESTAQFTKSAISVVQQLNKTALVWEEAFFRGGHVPKEAIVVTWTNRHVPSDVYISGRKTLNNNYKHSYLNFWPTENGQWSRYYHDIAEGHRPEARQHLLGGEVSMWADEYCDTCQCGGWAAEKCTPSARQFWPRRHDAEFAKSFAGMLWPRGFVMAQALWQYAPESATSPGERFDPASNLFHQQLMAVNTLVAKRGGVVCPSGCDCNEHKACGSFYLGD